MEKEVKKVLQKNCKLGIAVTIGAKEIFLGYLKFIICRILLVKIYS